MDKYANLSNESKISIKSYKSQRPNSIQFGLNIMRALEDNKEQKASKSAMIKGEAAVQDSESSSSKHL